MDALWSCLFESALSQFSAPIEMLIPLLGFWLFIPTPKLTSPSLLLIAHPPPFRGDNWCYFHWAINTETILHLSPLHLNSLHHTAINKA